MNPLLPSHWMSQAAALFVPASAASPGSADWSLTDQGSASPNATSATFTAKNIGVADSYRVVVIFVQLRSSSGGAYLTAVTINGTSAIIEARSAPAAPGAGIGGGCDAAIVWARVPSGSTADIVVTANASMSDVAIDVVRAIQYFPFSSGSIHSVSSPSVASMTVKVDSDATTQLAVATSVKTDQPGGMTLDPIDSPLYRDNDNFSTFSVSSGAKASTTPTIGLSETLTLTTSDNDDALTVVAFTNTLPSGSDGDTWTPTRCLGLSEWFKPETLGAGGTSISQWDDSSGNSNNATQATTGNQPTVSSAALNGFNAALFDASFQQRMILPTGLMSNWSGGSTIFFVTKGNKPSNQVNGFPFYTGGSSNNHWTYSDGKIYITCGIQSRQSFSFATPDSWHFVTVRAKNNFFEVNIDGTVVFSLVNNNSANVSLPANPPYLAYGGATWFHGLIAEAGAVRRCITNADVARLQGYMAWKFGMEANLPVGHTYTGAAPVLPDDLS